MKEKSSREIIKVTGKTVNNVEGDNLSHLSIQNIHINE